MTTQNEVALQNEARVLELRAQGRTTEQIANDPTVGITTRSGVAKALRRGLERRSRLGAEELVALSMEQLDQIDAAVSAVVTMPGVGAAEIIRALDLRRKVVETRAKMMGHDGSSVRRETSDGLVHHHGPQNAYSPPPGETRPFFLTVDITNVPAHLIPWDELEVNPAPGKGTSAEWGIPTVGINPACTGRGAAARVAQDGGLFHSGVYFRYRGVFEDIRNSDLLRYVAGDFTIT